MEVLEQLQSRRLAILDGTVFGLQLLMHMITVGHFIHIWSLHGVQFTLIDGVLGLHLHSALSSASRKIQERRNLHRIARDLDSMFGNASEMDLRKASAAGDVCCICLGGMNAVGQVKKVGCGHLYHTTCLRQVVERARSMEDARCPLCRANIVNGRHPGVGATNNENPAGGVNGPAGNNDNNNVAGRGAEANANANANGRDDRDALFRFSSEEVFPTWLPLPAFSFEVVRRPSAAPPAAPVETAAQQRQPQQQEPNNIEDRPDRASLLRRLLVLAGAAPMAPEDEAAALDQLVDMFPQYDRADLLRELRTRRSAEGVAESILAGSFVGTPRGAAFAAGVAG
jgi:hypothetical protein